MQNSCRNFAGDAKFMPYTKQHNATKMFPPLYELLCFNCPLGFWSFIQVGTGVKDVWWHRTFFLCEETLFRKKMCSKEYMFQPQRQHGLSSFGPNISGLDPLTRISLTSPTSPSTTSPQGCFNFSIIGGFRNVPKTEAFRVVFYAGLPVFWFTKPMGEKMDWCVPCHRNPLCWW